MASMAPKPRSEAAEHLKAVALRLFAQRGIDGVTVRQIAEAAGQKNHAAVGYYFGSKEALVRELIVDGARTIDIRRNVWLDACETNGGPHSVTEVIEGMIETSLDPEAAPGDESFNRFFMLLGLSHRAFFMEALEGRWNTGYQRCLVHLRRLMPDMPAAKKNERFVFLGSTLGAIIASRESELADKSRPHRMWQSGSTLKHAAKVIAAMMEAPFR
ncbi:MAG: TetR/AcrR family transcriptional regulator [Sphingomonadales bacterium]|nr:TetR/AcrR family transcriptional regulator [Sphingomonadales bacterium]MBK9002495.1 TetR/AcrR family transcriptional regulator [Sphingomonadales bacterium]MBK9267725.1 TetR/AcrR family transcriptional regulator [Sphingomonadales bacterium]MBP6433958.1 TetR/AcrR family transcriptional regulator [Sphingorhabdus sp.]